MSRFEQLGEQKEVHLPQGTIRYRERGTGAPIVFVHGLLVNGDLWRKVVPGLADRYRCISPDLPLGAHDVPMRADADLSPAGLAQILGDFIEALDAGPVTIVANDSGGGITQVLIAERPELAERIVLTPCDCFDNFPPAIFNYLKLTARVPGGMYLLAQSTRFKPMLKLPIAFGWIAKKPIEERAVASYLEPMRKSAGVRRDTAKFCKTVSPAYTLAAAEKLGRFTRPVLLDWAREDKLFPYADAERLARTFPDARLEGLDDCYTFVSEDAPEALTRLIAEFMEADRSAAASPAAGAAEPRRGSLGARS